jgi:hypothetical protein
MTKLIKNEKFEKGAYCLSCGKHLKKGTECGLIKTQNNNFLILCLDCIKKFEYKEGSYKIIKYGIKEPKKLTDSEKEVITKYISKNKRIPAWMKAKPLFFEYAKEVVEKRKAEIKKNKIKEHKEVKKRKYIKKQKPAEENSLFNYLSDEQKKIILK